MKKEGKGWTYSLKKTRISFKNNKEHRGDSFRKDEKKIKIAALEWDGFVLQEQLKSLMYFDCSIRGDPMKEKLIDELNFKKFVRLRRNK